MEPTERTGASAPEKPPRRVGTFTMGVVLVVGGTLMLISLFFPRLDYTWVLKLSPVILISLGVETLLAARGGGRVKYDWVGMVLTALIVGTALAMFVAAWYLLYRPDGIPL